MTDTVPTYRAYFFGNMYLSQIQHGIQAAHVVTKLFAKYPWSANHLNDTLYPCDILYAWATDDVTKILLNGGYQSNLHKVYQILEIVCPILGLPFEKFHEETDALNGALTSVGVVIDCEVLDADLYNATDEYVANYYANTVDQLYAFSNGRKLTTHEAKFVLHRLLKTGILA